MGVELAARVADIYIRRRFEEYHSALSQEPDRWIFWFAAEAVKNCYGAQQDLGATTEMMVIIGYFVKIVSGVLESMLA